MQPLNSILVEKRYKAVFKIDDITARKMADTVRGYPYAYQVLGYLCYKRQQPFSNVMDEFDAYLSEYVYEKIWSELSNQDKRIIQTLAKITDGRVLEIRDDLDMSSSKFSVYRDRLIKKAQKKFSIVQGIIPRFVIGSYDTAEAIRF